MMSELYQKASPEEPKFTLKRTSSVFIPAPLVSAPSSRSDPFITPKTTNINLCASDTVSYRPTTSGAYFIQTIADVFNKWSRECDVEELFKKVSLFLGSL